MNASRPITVILVPTSIDERELHPENVPSGIPGNVSGSSIDSSRVQPLNTEVPNTSKAGGITTLVNPVHD